MNMKQLEQMEDIHESLINGQRKQCVKKIDEYGNYDFWEDYKDFLDETYVNKGFEYFTDMTISYFRIKNR